MFDSAYSATSWTDIHGNRHKLEEMGERYRQNVLTFLRKRALPLYVAMKVREREETLDPDEPWDNWIPNDLLLLMVTLELKLNPPDEDEARVWLEKTPLVKQLKQMGAR